MVSGSEMKALKTVEKETGETTTRLVSRQLGVDPSYARVLCMKLIKSEHLAQENHSRFSITLKGKKSLDWPHEDAPLEAKQAIPCRNIQREEFQWRSFRAVGTNHNRTSNAFFKPGQDDVGWNTISVGNNGHNLAKGGNGIPCHSLLTEKSHMCGFCRGTGYRQKGVKCPVCRGTGSVTVTPPAVPCAFCKGTGEAQRRTPLKCTVCGGKGVVHISEPVEECNRCRGTGEDQNSKLPCLECQGKGAVRRRQNHGKR